MRLAALIQKPRHGADVLSAGQVLELATAGGARALGLEQELGAIAVGRRADLVVLDLRGPHLAPTPPDPVSHLVYAAQASDVRDVFVDGRPVVLAGELLTMSLDEICALPVLSLASPDAALFMWTTAPHLRESFDVLVAWGFGYKTNIVWVKDKIGTGYWNRNQHEHLLIGTRGEIPAPAPGEQFPSVINAPRGKHSAKPQIVREMIDGTRQATIPPHFP